MERSPKCTNLEKRSIMVRMVVLPDEGGRPVTKSKAMWDHGLFGVGRGRIRPAGRVFGTLFCAQTKQVVTYSCVPLTKEGQQNRCWRNWRVILTWVRSVHFHHEEFVEVPLNQDRNGEEQLLNLVESLLSRGRPLKQHFSGQVVWGMLPLCRSPW